MIAGADGRALAGRLAGRRVLVTRPGESAAAWAEELERLGAVPVVRSGLETTTLGGEGAAARARDLLDACAWLVLTSARAVEALEEILGTPPGVTSPVAVVGTATGRRARAAGLDVALEATGGTVEALAEQMTASLPECRDTAGRPVVVHAGAEDTRPGLERLEEEGRARLVRLPLYRTRPAPGLPETEREDLDVDVVLLASPSAVRGLVGRVRIPARAHVVTIGPSTTAAARDAGLVVAGEAVTRDLLGLLRAIPQETS